MNSTSLSYFPLTSVAAATGTLSSAEKTVNVNGSIGSITITLSANVNAGAANANFALYKNGSSVSSCSIAAGAAPCTITGVSLAKGDTVAIAYSKSVGSATTISNKSFTAAATYTWGSAAIG